MITTITTIGTYGCDATRFIETLTGAGVTHLIDVRQRRGVRGTDYAWANSRRLQALLDDAGIGYRHEKTLAPTTELRHLQYAADARAGVGKRSRRTLDPAYVDRYRSEILARAAVGSLFAWLPSDALPALFCVERDPDACHRALIASALAKQHGIAIRHMVPSS